MPILSLNDEESLGRVVDQHEIVVIDFCAPWCPPCKGFLPILEEAAEAHPGIVFCRVDTGEHKELAEAFDVESVPTLVVVRDGIMIASQPGLLPRNVLEELISKVKELDMDEVREELASSEEREGEAS